jgi:N-acetyl-gamma-glutamyl-phosphate reductase
MIMHMSFSVAVAGASGYAGGETLRLLLGHPEATIGALTAHANAGSRLGPHQPHLRALADRVLTPTTVDELAGHDVVVLALPHGASGEVAAALADRGDPAVVVDLGADHRLTDPTAWSRYYGTEHAGTWPYGMPELLHAGETTPAAQRAALAQARRIAVPGCNVTAVTLGMQPGVAAGIVDPTDLVAVLAVGYSGAGRSLKPHLLASEALGSAQPYAVGGTHRHIPEIVQNLGVAGATGTPLAPGADPDAVRAAWEAAYADEPFVRLLPEGEWPTTGMTTGANTALVQVAVDADAGRVVTVTALDNLVKGTAGAAVQSLNLALGLPETTGLSTEGVAP